MACLVLTSQLPPAVQNPLKDWIATQDEITKPIACDFIIKVRKVLTEKGIPLDRGNRDLDRLLELRSGECEKRTTPGSVENDHKEEGKHRNPKEYGNTAHRDDTLGEGVNAISRRNYSSGLSRPSYSAGRGTKSQGKQLACYVCGDTRHLQPGFLPAFQSHTPKWMPPFFYAPRLIFIYVLCYAPSLQKSYA